jgi:hypothetical protein
MKILLSLAFVAGSRALVSRWTSCCFGLSASGAVTGTLGQLDDGQNRVNGPLSPAEYCISGTSITDANGRGCILTRRLNPYSRVLHMLIDTQHLHLNSNAMSEPHLHLVSPLAVMAQLPTTEELRSGNVKLEMMFVPPLPFPVQLL